MLFNAEFIFSASSLILGVMAGIYLFYIWLRDNRKHSFVILWALALFIFYWFKVPTILLSTGLTVTLADYSLFLIVSLSAFFLAHVFIYFGIHSILPLEKQKKINRYILYWSTLLVLFLVFHLFDIGGFARVPIWISNVLFYMPLQAIVLHSLIRWHRSKDILVSRVGSIGVKLMMGAFVLLIVTSFIYVYQILTYGQGLWFVAVTSSYFNSFLQSLSVILLLAGMVMVHKDTTNKYLRE